MTSQNLESFLFTQSKESRSLTSAHSERVSFDPCPYQTSLDGENELRNRHGFYQSLVFLIFDFPSFISSLENSLFLLFPLKSRTVEELLYTDVRAMFSCEKCFDDLRRKRCAP